MKKDILFILITIVMIGCNNSQLKKTDNCDIGEFTKSINSPKTFFIKDTLIMNCGPKTDFFNSPDGDEKNSNAPLLMKEIDNTKPFTFCVKMKPRFSKTYDAGAMYIFYNDNLWQKFAFEMDERGLTRLVTVRTIETSDDNNHDAIEQKEVYMKISSNTKNIGFYYSINNETWQLVRLYRNDYPKSIYLGISSQSPIGEGIEVQFSDIEFSNKSIDDFRLGL